MTFSNCNHVSTEGAVFDSLRLSYGVASGFLRWLLSKAGTVLCFSLQRSEEGKSLGWGSCTFDCRDAAERAVERFQGAWVDNRQIHLEVDAWCWKMAFTCIYMHLTSVNFIGLIC